MYDMERWGPQLLEKKNPLLDELARQLSYPERNKMKYMDTIEKNRLTSWITKDIAKRLQSARRRAPIDFLLANRRGSHYPAIGEGKDTPRLPDEMTRIIVDLNGDYQNMFRKTTGLMVPTWRCGLTLGPTRQDDHVPRATPPWAG